MTFCVPDDMLTRAKARKMTPQAYMAWRQALRMDYWSIGVSWRPPVSGLGFGGSLWRLLVPEAAP